ncbi:MAG: ATP-binding cassette domain-containing protein, partial [Bauldia sp.]|nr:ATP-binding cassette domain-containing protein [Bauldia sp.]
MAFLRLRNVGKRFGEVAAVDDVSFEAGRGEFIVFVGPSGCGKSTLLRTIAGLEEASAGTIEIDGRDVTDVVPAGREVSMVFQSYALFPHMTVRDNMGFGLKMSRMPKAEIGPRVNEAARILQIEHLLDRKPRQLSGGQRQRVAIGRAIVRQPKLFLFDEPLSNLDADLRTQMRVEIARLHEQLGVTMIYVTHDQVEAMTLADRIVVMRGGRVEQIGSPADLYERPANAFVAGFIGSPKMNFVPVTVAAADADTLTLSHPALASGTARVPSRGTAGVKPGDRLTLG